MKDLQVQNDDDERDSLVVANTKLFQNHIQRSQVEISFCRRRQKQGNLFFAIGLMGMFITLFVAFASNSGPRSIDNIKTKIQRVADDVIPDPLTPFRGPSRDYIIKINNYADYRKWVNPH